MNLSGWVTLTNNSGTSFKNAKTQLVAGNINLSSSENDYWRREQAIRAQEGAGGTAPSAQESIGDYDLYTLPERVTLAENQTKQVSFLDLRGIRADKTYEFRADGFNSYEQPVHADVVIKFDNADRPLPAGVVRVYMRDKGGDPKFIGEDGIDHTPPGSSLAVKIGESFDVTVQPAVVTSEKISRWRTRYAMSYTIRNARADGVTVELRQTGLMRDGKVETESLPSKRVDAHTLNWSVPVPANGQTVLTFTVDAGG